MTEGQWLLTHLENITKWVQEKTTPIAPWPIASYLLNLETKREHFSSTYDFNITMKNSLFIQVHLTMIKTIGEIGHHLLSNGVPLMSIVLILHYLYLKIYGMKFQRDK